MYGRAWLSHLVANRLSCDRSCPWPLTAHASSFCTPDAMGAQQGQRTSHINCSDPTLVLPLGSVPTGGAICTSDSLAAIGSLCNGRTRTCTSGSLKVCVQVRSEHVRYIPTCGQLRSFHANQEPVVGKRNNHMRAQTLGVVGDPAAQHELHAAGALRSWRAHPADCAMRLSLKALRAVPQLTFQLPVPPPPKGSRQTTGGTCPSWSRWSRPPTPQTTGSSLASAATSRSTGCTSGPAQVRGSRVCVCARGIDTLLRPGVEACRMHDTASRRLQGVHKICHFSLSQRKQPHGHHRRPPFDVHRSRLFTQVVGGAAPSHHRRGEQGCSRSSETCIELHPLSLPVYRPDERCRAQV